MPETKRRTPFERLTNHRKNERVEILAVEMILIVVLPLLVLAVILVFMLPSRNEVSSLSKNQATRAIIKQSCPIPGDRSLRRLSESGKFKLGEHSVRLTSKQGFWDDLTKVNLTNEGSKYIITNVDTKKVLCTFSGTDTSRPFAKK